MKYGVYAAYFFRGIATLTLAMTRKFNRATAFFRFWHKSDGTLLFRRKDSGVSAVRRSAEYFFLFSPITGRKNLKIYAKSGNIDI